MKSKTIQIPGLGSEHKTGKGPYVFAQGKGVLHRQGDHVSYPGIQVDKPKKEPPKKA